MKTSTAADNYNNDRSFYQEHIEPKQSTIVNLPQSFDTKVTLLLKNLKETSKHPHKTIKKGFFLSTIYFGPNECPLIRKKIADLNADFKVLKRPKYYTEINNILVDLHAKAKRNKLAVNETFEKLEQIKDFYEKKD